MLSQREISAGQLSTLAGGGYVFAIVDACVNREVVMEKAYSGEAKAVCLFQNTYMESYDAAAPFLFCADPALLQWIAGSLDQARWGIFILTKERLEVLAPHFQRFLMVALPSGHKGFFRFYDPRILRTYLPTCHPAELREFFGPVRGFAMTDPEERKIWVFEFSASSASELAQSPVHPNGLWPVRPEQYHAFGNLSREHFVKKVAAHARQFFPERYELLGKEQVDRMIHYGIQKAAACGITTEPEICGYIDFLFALGTEFDRDPRFGWAAAILTDQSRSAAVRMAEMSKIVDRLVKQAKLREGGH